MAAKATIAVTAAICAVLATSPAADGPSLTDVMRRVAAYVQAYGDQASIVVATERYTQRLTGSAPTGIRERHIVADFAIVRVEAHHVWLGVRDVYEVDGERIADRADRLIDVLTRAQGTYDEARRINDESARFNIGNVERNFNVPTAVLFFFTPDDLDRFRFSLRDRSGALLEIGFRETYRPTLIRTSRGESVPATGVIQVDPATGAIVRTSLKLSNFITAPGAGRFGTAEIDVRYRQVEELGMWLPETMTESYVAHGRAASWNVVTGRAEYSNYRRFQTSARVK